MKPTAILTADWHIRDTTPKCRTDDYEKAMFNKLLFIIDLAQKHDIPILIAGDLGDKPKWSNWILKHFISMTNRIKIIAVAGQHDLINHRFDSLNHTAMGVLLEAKAITVPQNEWEGINCFHYGIPMKMKLPVDRCYSEIAISHQMVIKKNSLWPGQIAPKALQLLKKHPQYKLILTGDNHKPFVVKHDGRILVNPGSMMRMKTDQINHKPRIYLWYEKTNTIKKVYLPIKDNVIDRNHIEIEQERDERIDAYIESMNEDYDIDLLFVENMHKHFNANRAKKRVKEKTWEAIKNE